MNTQLISKVNKGIRFLLRVTDVCSKYTWGFPLKDKKESQLLMLFQEVLNESGCKPNKTWVDKSSEFLQ